MRSSWLCALLAVVLAAPPEGRVFPSNSPPNNSSPVLLTGPPGLYQIQVSRPARLIHGSDSVTIAWGSPPPEPVPTPAPPPEPALDPDSPSPQPVPETELGRATRAYVRQTIEGTAQAWETIANQLAAGETTHQAFRKGAQVQTELRLHALRVHIAPLFNRTLPEGAEPADSHQRAAAAAMYREFAAELRRSLP
jgi:hypothetical protein